MSIRLIVTIHALPGAGAELARAYQHRCPRVRQEPGCEQFEIFQSVENPDKLTLLECWRDQAALDAHAALRDIDPPPHPELRAGPGEREDYIYRRTR